MDADRKFESKMMTEAFMQALPDAAGAGAVAGPAPLETRGDCESAVRFPPVMIRIVVRAGRAVILGLPPSPRGTAA